MKQAKNNNKIKTLASLISLLKMLQYSWEQCSYEANDCLANTFQFEFPQSRVAKIQQKQTFDFYCLHITLC